MGSSSRLTVLGQLGQKGCLHANGILLLQSAWSSDCSCLLVFHELKSSFGTRLISRSTARLCFSAHWSWWASWENSRTHCGSSGMASHFAARNRQGKIKWEMNGGLFTFQETTKNSRKKRSNHNKGKRNAWKNPSYHNFKLGLLLNLATNCIIHNNIGMFDWFPCGFVLWQSFESRLEHFL